MNLFPLLFESYFFLGLPYLQLGYFLSNMPKQKDIYASKISGDNLYLTFCLCQYFYIGSWPISQLGFCSDFTIFVEVLKSRLTAT